MKWATCLTACMAVFSGLSTLGYSEAAPAADPYRWNVPLIWTPPHHVRMEQEAFRERVRERTKGQADISLFQFGEIGLVDSDVLSIVRGGEFPLVELDHAKTAGDEPVFMIFNLPGLAFSIEDSMAIGEATDEVLKRALDDWNAVGLGMVHYMAPQGIFTKQPVRTVEDLRGVGIRVYSGVLLRAFELLGARPQLIPWGDTPAALLQGLVDGAITTPSSGVDVGFGDTTRYLTIMPVSNRVDWIMNKDVWESLSPEVQAILKEEAAASAARLRANWEREERDVAQLVERAGMTFIPPSPEFQAEVTRRLRPIWEEWAASTPYGPEALERALKALGRN